ncbi:hypothetical protein Trydic_g7218 [Trypoxylus dichotomus]
MKSWRVLVGPKADSKGEQMVVVMDGSSWKVLQDIYHGRLYLQFSSVSFRLLSQKAKEQAEAQERMDTTRSLLQTPDYCKNPKDVQQWDKRPFTGISLPPVRPRAPTSHFESENLNAFSGFQVIQTQFGGESGMDDIFLALRQQGLDLLFLVPCSLLRATLAVDHLPRNWREARVIFIPKQGKTSYTEAKSYRPISLTSFLFIGHKEIALANFLDIEGAFDRASFLSMERALQRRGVGSALTGWIAAMLNNTRTVHVSTNLYKIGAPVAADCSQDDVLSPLLWCLLVIYLLSDLRKTGFYAHVGETTIMVSGRFEEVVSERMQVALRLVETWYRKEGLGVNSSKTTMCAVTIVISIDTATIIASAATVAILTTLAVAATSIVAAITVIAGISTIAAIVASAASAIIGVNTIIVAIVA